MVLNKGIGDSKALAKRISTLESHIDTAKQTLSLLNQLEPDDERDLVIDFGDIVHNLCVMCPDRCGSFVMLLREQYAGAITDLETALDSYKHFAKSWEHEQANASDNNGEQEEAQTE